MALKFGNDKYNLLRSIMPKRIFKFMIQIYNSWFLFMSCFSILCILSVCEKLRKFVGSTLVIWLKLIYFCIFGTVIGIERMFSKISNRNLSTKLDSFNPKMSWNEIPIIQYLCKVSYRRMRKNLLQKIFACHLFMLSVFYIYY